MKSHEVIRNAVNEPGVKAVAAALKVSAALVYKWCEPPAAADDPDQSGARNPLDRVRELYRLTKDIHLIRWLCAEAGGFYFADPDIKLEESVNQSLFVETGKMVRDFSELLEAITKAHEEEPGIDAREADLIRLKWDDLKSLVEGFVRKCEGGLYGPGKV